MLSPDFDSPLAAGSPNPAALSPTPASAQEPAAEPAEDSLVDKLVDWLKSPAVMAGGAVVVGIVVARLVGRDVLRQWVGGVVANFLKSRPSPAAPAAALTPPPAAPAEPAAPAAGGVVGSTLLGMLAAQALPVVLEAAKKMLAQSPAKKQ